MTAPIAVTPGEPAGIGPDLCLLYAARKTPGWDRLVCIADPGLLRARAGMLGLHVPVHHYDGVTRPGCLNILPLALQAPCTPGKPDPANSPGVLAALDRAVAGCQKGEFSALVTGPVQKSAINDAGIPFSGHTEYLAGLCGCEHVVMMLATPGLRVALATTHLPLAAVPGAITRELLANVITILHNDLKDRFGIARPRIVVAGLNPHAGEGGHLGREEIDTLIPVLEQCRQAGMDLAGPLPADTLFTPKYLEGADAVLAMYHDQGLPVLKYKGFGNAVNVTLGLPFVRTSVDHGTALDLAGTGKAATGSLEYAIEVAREMAAHGEHHAAP